MIAVRKSSVASVVDKVLEECAVLGKAAYFRCLLRAGKKRRNAPPLKVVIIHTSRVLG